MKKFSRVITGATLCAAAAALVIGTLGIASAQAAPGGGEQGPGNRGGSQSSLIEQGIITQTQADAVRAAMRNAHEGVETTVLAGLVRSGSISQTQADAISAAKKSTSREARATLLTDANVTMVQLQSVRAAMKQAHESGKATVLATLVQGGTITQSQADAIGANKRTGGRS